MSPKHDSEYWYVQSGNFLFKRIKSHSVNFNNLLLAEKAGNSCIMDIEINVSIFCNLTPVKD